MTDQSSTSIEIHTDEKCIFNYCPTPEICREKGCQHPELDAGGGEMDRHVCSCGKQVDGDDFMHTSCFRKESLNRSHNKSLVLKMVDRFLRWRLPDDFCPDAGISFNPEYNAEYMSSIGKPPMRHEPTGTNLLDAEQAAEMIDDIIGRDKLYTQTDIDKAVAEKTAELEAKCAAMNDGLRAVEQLIDESTGVYGLHLNGDNAPWEELRTGGRYEEWLAPFDTALDAGKDNNHE